MATKIAVDLVRGLCYYRDRSVGLHVTAVTGRSSVPARTALRIERRESNEL